MSSETSLPKRADWLTALDNMLPYSLALVLISSFLWFIYLIVIRQPPDLDLLKTMSAIFLGPIGTILGFYFGHRPAEKLEQRVQELIKVNGGMLRELEQRKNELQAKTEVATERIERAVADKESALSQLEKLRNQVERLRK